MYAEELLLLLLALGIVGWAVLVAPIICLVGISRLKGRIARLEEQLALTAAAPATARRAATPSL